MFLFALILFFICFLFYFILFYKTKQNDYEKTPQVKCHWVMFSHNFSNLVGWISRSLLILLILSILLFNLFVSQWYRRHCSLLALIPNFYYIADKDDDVTWIFILLHASSLRYLSCSNQTNQIKLWNKTLNLWGTYNLLLIL